MEEEERSYGKAERDGEFQPARRTLIVRTEDDYLPALLPNALMFWNPEKGSTWKLLAYTKVVPVRSGRRTTLWGVSRWLSYWSGRGGLAPVREVSTADRAFVETIDSGSWARTASQLSEVAIMADENQTFQPV